jgi:ABC-type amino acid transport substrate-binding protein
VYNARRIKSLETVGVFQYHPVGVEDDSVPSFYLLTAFAGRLSSNVKHFVSPSAAFAAMQDGKVDAVMAMRGELEWLLSQASDAQLKKSDAAYPNLGQSTWEVGMAVHESNRQLAYAVEALTEAMIRDGRMQALYAKYHLSYETPEMYQ